jgi:hypothetical protein
MRAKFSLVGSGATAELVLAPDQREAILTAIGVVVDLRVADTVVSVQFGASREEFRTMAIRFGEMDDRVIRLDLVEIRVTYSLLRSLPDCFASDEAFYVRTGLFKENFFDLARGFLDAVSELS